MASDDPDAANPTASTSFTFSGNPEEVPEIVALLARLDAPTRIRRSRKRIEQGVENSMLPVSLAEAEQLLGSALPEVAKNVATLGSARHFIPRGAVDSPVKILAVYSREATSMTDLDRAPLSVDVHRSTRPSSKIPIGITKDSNLGDSASILIGGLPATIVNTGFDRIQYSYLLPQVSDSIYVKVVSQLDWPTLANIILTS